MTSKKKKAKRAAYFAQQIFGRTPPSPQSSSPLQPPTSPLQNIGMASRRDSSPLRRSEPIPRGPRGSGADGCYFTSTSWKPPRDYPGRRRSRSRSRSRSPGGDRRRFVERDDPYDYGKDARPRAAETYRPRYEDTPTRPLIRDPRREY